MTSRQMQNVESRTYVDQAEWTAEFRRTSSPFPRRLANKKVETRTEHAVFLTKRPDIACILKYGINCELIPLILIMIIKVFSNDCHMACNQLRRMPNKLHRWWSSSLDHPSSCIVDWFWGPLGVICVCFLRSRGLFAWRSYGAILLFSFFFLGDFILVHLGAGLCRFVLKIRCPSARQSCSWRSFASIPRGKKWYIIIVSLFVLRGCVYKH